MALTSAQAKALAGTELGNLGPAGDPFERCLAIVATRTAQATPLTANEIAAIEAAINGIAHDEDEAARRVQLIANYGVKRAADGA
jgi:hypothetical protein